MLLECLKVARRKEEFAGLIRPSRCPACNRLPKLMPWTMLQRHYYVSKAEAGKEFNMLTMVCNLIPEGTLHVL
jgi:hypothetical protein